MAANTVQTEPVRLYNRQTHRVEDEQVPGKTLLATLYGRPWGRLFCSGVMSRIWFSRLYGWAFHRPFSRRQISAFVRKHHIDLSEIEVPANGFATFNDFFIRRLKPGARPVAQDPAALIAPADSRLKVFVLQNHTILDIKGDGLTLPQLLGTSSVPQVPADGLCLQFRLAPCDYHRFGYIEDGVQGPVHSVGGRLFSVSPLALRHMPTIWGRNFRQWCSIKTRTLGAILQIEVGATVVGSIVQHQPSGGCCTRGGEKGYFQMGGSTVLIVLPPDRVEIDEDIMHYCRQGIETLVRYGESVGRVL